MENRTETTKADLLTSRRGRLLKALDIAATVVSLMGGIAVVGAATALYERHRPSTPPPAIPKEPVSIEEAALQGSSTAPAVLVVFSDFQCPFCRAFAQDVLPQVIDKFVTPGKVQLAYMPFPLVHIHPLAMKAAREAACAEAQGRYWQMHEQLFQAPDLTDQDLNRFSSAIGLDGNQFQRCMSDPATSATLERNIAASESLAISGTPTFFVGLRAGPHSVQVVRRFSAARTFQQVASQLDDTVKDGVIGHRVF
jgi:protein-disulfide isomerase